jgi:hypothetical protein
MIWPLGSTVYERTAKTIAHEFTLPASAALAAATGRQLVERLLLSERWLERGIFDATAV